MPNEALLRVGSRGDAVSMLQRALKISGLDTGPIDGILGVLTQVAVGAFQIAHGLQADNIVGATTWEAVLEVLRRDDPFNVIHSGVMENAQLRDVRVATLPPLAFSEEPFEDKELLDAGEVQPARKIHPVLEQRIAAQPDDHQEVMVTLQDPVNIPRFPELIIDEPRESPLNQVALGVANRLVNELVANRADAQTGLAERLLRDFEAAVQETFWLVNAVLVSMPLRQVPALAQLDEVLFVEPRNADEEPPQNSNPNDDVDNGRARIVSDPYFNLGQTGGFIGLLDTGVRFTHTQFNSPSHIGFRRDCINGGSDCNTGSGLNPNDDCWNHGTSSAGIITGNANQGDAFRGVTGVTLDSFKVYATASPCGGLDYAAAVRGFQTAVAVLDRVIVAEMQGGGSDTSSVSVAADNAFDAGAVVIAANGNNGPNSSTVNTPANAHKAIGVGNFDVETLTQIDSQSRGPAPDNRYKPDIQAPTNTETASNSSDTALRRFGGTSGATPYAAGAAALLRNWLRGGTGTIDPGQVYAQLILSGQRPFPFDNTQGAGPIRLPVNGQPWWGKVSVGNGQTINITLGITASTAHTLDAALWWPETPSQAHNDVDLSLVDPGGTVRASSTSGPSVFERARVSGSIQTGNWTLRIRGFSVPSGPQTVYWTAHVVR